MEIQDAMKAFRTHYKQGLFRTRIGITDPDAMNSAKIITFYTYADPQFHKHLLLKYIR